LRLRYPGECSICGIELSRGTEAIWKREEKTVTCLACAPAEGAPEPGSAGSSAASEGVRRRDRRIEEVRRKHGDHAAATGVWIVDAKSYKGKVEQREHGPIWRRESEVYVGGRNRSALTKSIEKQVAAVKAALEPDPELRGTNVYGSLCFLDSEWGLLDFPFSAGSVWIAYPGALRKSLKTARSRARRWSGSRGGST
jgi:hypothetical protein